MSQDRPYKNEERLRRLYWDEGKSLQEVADACDCAINTIQRWMNKFDIPTRDEAGYAPDESPKHRDPDWLRKQYHERGLTIEEISEMVDVTSATIIQNMESYDIERRDHSQKQMYATFYTDKRGYEFWTSWTESHGKNQIGVHRLVAVAHYGIDAVKDMHVHHDNEIPWDNRICNLELKSESEHRSIHAKRMGLHELGAEATRQDS